MTTGSKLTLYDCDSLRQFITQSFFTVIHYSTIPLSWQHAPYNILAVLYTIMDGEMHFRGSFKI